jgi:hypothetical protein
LMEGSGGYSSIRRHETETTATAVIENSTIFIQPFMPMM